MRSAVRTIRDKYGRCRRMAQTAVGELTGHIRDILEENAQRQEKLLSVVNVDDYYSRITEEMLENSRKFQELSFHLLKLAGEGKVKEQEPETVYEPVLRFCRGTAGESCFSSRISDGDFQTAEGMAQALTRYLRVRHF